MKKNLILVFIAIASFVVSCGKDEDNSLEGTWYLESVTENGVTVELSACEKKTFVTFSGNTYSSVSYDDKNLTGDCTVDDSITGTYSVVNGTMTTVNSDGETSTTFYSVSRNKLTITEKVTKNGVVYTIVIILKKE